MKEKSEKTEEKTDEKAKEKKTAKSGNKSDGKLVQKEKAEEGGVSGSIFISYFRACGWHWVFIYILWSLVYQAADIMYNVWLSIWVDAIPNYNKIIEDGSDNCLPRNLFQIPSVQVPPTYRNSSDKKTENGM